MVIYNDDVTPFIFVIAVLKTVFLMSNADSISKTQEAQDKGSAVVGVYPKSIAEAKVKICLDAAKIQKYPFRVEMERE